MPLMKPSSFLIILFGCLPAFALVDLNLSEGFDKATYPKLDQVQKAWKKASSSSGVRSVIYNAETVYKIATRENMPTTIVLPKGEEIHTATSGDLDLFGTKIQNKRFLIVWCKGSGIDTSLTILSKSGKVYPFYVKAVNWLGKKIPDLVVRIKKTERRKTRKVNKEINKHITPIDMAYTMAGDHEIAPDFVWNDGLFTTFEFGNRFETVDLPVVHKIIDGVDTPVNTRVQSTQLIAEALGDFCLVTGRRRVCVRRK